MARLTCCFWLGTVAPEVLAARAAGAVAAGLAEVGVVVVGAVAVEGPWLVAAVVALPRTALPLGFIAV